MAEQNEAPKIELFALWENTSKNGTTYYTGRLGNNRLIAFENTNRKSDKEPALRVYIQPIVDKPTDSEEDASIPF